MAEQQQSEADIPQEPMTVRPPVVPLAQVEAAGRWKQRGRVATCQLLKMLKPTDCLPQTACQQLMPALVLNKDLWRPVVSA